MTPTLTWNSSLTSISISRCRTRHSRLTLRNPRVRVFAKKAEGSLPEGDGSSNNNNNNNNPFGLNFKFKFNFENIPDVTSLIPVPSNTSAPGFSRRKDPSTVFVAGATGLAGIRIAQTLLREGFIVRAGVPELASAQQLALLASQYKIISNEQAKRLNAVLSSFDNADSIAKAIGNASKVVVTIGPTENGPTAEVSTSDALQVIQAAQLAGVGHVAVIYDESSAGTSTYNVLDGLSSFFNNLFSRSQPLTVQEFLQKVIETDVKYTFIKTSLTDDFTPESSYNVVVLGEGSVSANDYKVM